MQGVHDSVSFLRVLMCTAIRSTTRAAAAMAQEAELSYEQSWAHGKLVWQGITHVCGGPTKQWFHNNFETTVHEHGSWYTLYNTTRDINMWPAVRLGGVMPYLSSPT